MACNLVTNFKVASIKKLWQCSVPNGTLRVGLPSPPQLTLGEGEGEGTATRRLPRDPCDLSIGLSSIPFAFSSYSRSAVEARNCQIGQIGKIKTASHSKSENPLVFFAKTENQMLKNGKSANRDEHQNRKSEVFGVETEKTEKPI